MPANTSGPIWELVPSAGAPKTFTSADTTTKKTVLTAGTFGTRVDQVSVTSDDTAAVNLAFYLKDGTTSFYIGNVNVPIGSGYTTIAKVDAITTLAPVLGYLVVPTGYTLECNCVAAMTAAKTVTVVCHGGDY